MVIHTQAINHLSPEDYSMIVNEHKLLETYLNNLRDACPCSGAINQADDQFCNREKQTSCQGRLVSFLFSISELAANHFEHEERIMLARPRVTETSEYFRLHRQDHERIMEKLNALVDRCLSLGNDGDVAQIYRQFHQDLLEIFNEHNRNFDDPFLESTQL